MVWAKRYACRAYFRMTTCSACVKHRLLTAFICHVEQFELILQPGRRHEWLCCFAFEISVLFFSHYKINISSLQTSQRVCKNIEKEIDISQPHYLEITAFNILHMFFLIFFCATCHILKPKWNYFMYTVLILDFKINISWRYFYTK